MLPETGFDADYCIQESFCTRALTTTPETASGESAVQYKFAGEFVKYFRARKSPDGSEGNFSVEAASGVSAHG